MCSCWNIHGKLSLNSRSMSLTSPWRKRLPQSDASCGVREQAAVALANHCCNQRETGKHLYNSIPLSCSAGVASFLSKKCFKVSYSITTKHLCFSYRYTFNEQNRVSFLSKIPKEKERLPVNLVKMFSIFLVEIP